MTHSANSETKNTDDARVAGVRFQPMGKVYHFDASSIEDIQAGDYVLVETVRGQQLGEVVDVGPLGHDNTNRPLKPVKRRASGRDLALLQEWRNKEEAILKTANEIVSELNLPIKLVTAEYTFDGKRLTLLYVCEEKRGKLGSLRKRLQQITNCRVDIRRIGVRDQAKLMGGYGACGEQRCCSRFITEFTPISIKMAKTQGVSLNPAEITGMCGRLRCCLCYENEQYKRACQSMPRRKKRVNTPHGEGKVIDLLPLKDVVVVQIEDRRIEVPTEDVEVIKK